MRLYATTCNRFVNNGFINLRVDGLLPEPVKLMFARDGIGHDVQSADDGRCRRIGLPNCWRSKIVCRLQTESGKIRRPGQNRIFARRRYGQLRQTGKTRIRVEAVGQIDVRAVCNQAGRRCGIYASEWVYDSIG